MAEPAAYALMADLPIAPHTEASDALGPGAWTTLTEFAGLLRRDGLRFVRHRLAHGARRPLESLLELTRDGGFARAEQLIAQISAPDEAGVAPVIDCRAGCSACCRLFVEASIPEVILVAAQIAAPNDPRRAVLSERAGQVVGLNSAQRARLGIACAFLADDNRCSVYAHRPLACRSFLAADAQRCHAAVNNAVAGSGDLTFGLYALPQLAGRAYRTGLCGVLKDLGLEYQPIDLMQGVSAILANPNLIGRWLAGETVFAACRVPPLDLSFDRQTPDQS